MNFLELQRYVYRRTGHADTPPTAVSDRIKQFLNARQRDLLTMEGMERFRQARLTFASDTSNSEYALPQAIVKILAVSERTNDYPLDYMTLDEYRLYSADPTAYEGTPSWYVELGESAVAQQPPSNKEISFKSSAAGDTVPTVSFEFITDNNYQRTVTGPKLNGTTAVSADTAIKDVSHITNAYLSDTATGTISIHYAGDTTVDGGGELARIPPKKTRARYYRIALVPKPSSAITYHVDADLEITDMVDDKDEPRIPRDFHYVIAEGALVDEFQKQEKERESKRSELKWFAGIKSLKNYHINNPDYIPVIGRTQRRAISRLGPFYPADYYPFS